MTPDDAPDRLAYELGLADHDARARVGRALRIWGGGLEGPRLIDRARSAVESLVRSTP